MTVLIALLANIAAAEDVLHERIDQLIAAKATADGVELQPPASDAAFVRRAYLDFAGRIPTVAEARSFLDEPSPDKRAKLIDRLLAGDGYPRRMAELFNVMLMERRGENDEWKSFLQQAFSRNAPWDEIARAIVKPNADDEQRRGAAFFMTARLVSEGAMAEVDVPALTRDVGRMFAGVDLQCAQCHDHVNINDYKQRDFQGLHMIFENVQKRGDTKFPAIGEKLMTEKQKYSSVFIQTPEETGPVVPGGKEIEITVYEGDDAYIVPPDKKKRTPGEPKFSPLGELAGGLASKENELFRKNIANRLWQVMMGRGLVEPLDFQHANNHPSHPELLDLLADELAAHDFDIQWLLRELALSETYQRTSLLPGDEDAPPPDTFAVALERQISAEQLFRNVLAATGELEARGKSWEAPVEEFEAAVREDNNLAKLQKLFVNTYANPPAEPELEFAPTVEAALFLMHEDRVLKLLQPREGNLIGRLSKLDGSDKIADELFLAILSRPPTDEDRQDVAEYLKKHPDDKPAALSQLAWALLASTEFCVNH